jgi:type IV pilus assembly protein PilC
MAGLNIADLKAKTSNKGTETSSLFSFLNKDIQLFPFKFSDRVKESLYLEISILLDAGVDIKAALELTESQQKNKKVQATLNRVKDDVIAGYSLSAALMRCSHFTPYEYYSVQIGEETGKIVEVLKQLAQYYNKKIKQQRQFINAISYPALIFCTSLGAVFFMLYFIVPMFSDIFKRFGGELPYITKVIIAISQTLSDNFLYILICVTAITGGIYRARSKPWFQKYTYYIIRSVPLIGKVLIKIQLARFCTSMGLLTAARVPLIRAIQLMKQMVTFYPLQESLQNIEEEIMAGKHLYASLSNFSVYDQRMIALIKVGEEVNQLDQFFQKLAIAYSEEAEYQTSLLSTFLEPFMIIFLGLVVGLILVAMYMPMFQLSTSIGG